VAAVQRLGLGIGLGERRLRRGEDLSQVVVACGFGTQARIEFGNLAAPFGKLGADLRALVLDPLDLDAETLAPGSFAGNVLFQCLQRSGATLQFGDTLLAFVSRAFEFASERIAAAKLTRDRGFPAS
jgi:hypothetical protein